MNAKMLIAGVLGGLTFFLLGWLIYGIILADSMGGGACMRANDAMLIHWIGIGNLFTGLALSYAFSKMSGVTTFGSGAITGGIFGLLLAIGWDGLSYGTTTMMESPNYILMSAIIAAVMWGLAGGVVGWWLGRDGGARGKGAGGGDG